MYCNIKRNLEDEVYFECSDFECVIAQIASLNNVDELGRLIEEHGEQKEYEYLSDMGYSVVLENKFNQVLRLGVSELGWLVLQVQPEPTKWIKEQSDDERIIGFDLEGWTEVLVRNTLKPEAAEIVVRNWLDKGILPK